MSQKTRTYKLYKLHIFRVQELASQLHQMEQTSKSQNLEIERLRQDNKNQRSNLKDSEDQVKRCEETIERLKKVKADRDVELGDMEESTREQVQELRRQIEDRQKVILITFFKSVFE